MDTKIYKILANDETDIYNSNVKTNINKLYIVNTAPRDEGLTEAEDVSITFLYVREIAVGEQVANQLIADDIGNKITIAPNGFELESGARWKEKNTTLNPNHVLSILSNKTCDVYLSILD